jgi:hypothetical protein
MTPRIRILMAAAAALIVAVVGFALIGRPQPDGVGASPSASALSTPLVSPSPALFERQSLRFDPFVGPGETPPPRSGALTFSTPALWENPGDFPTAFQIRPPDVGESAGIWLWSDVVVVSEEDPCSETPEPNVGETAQDITNWLAGASGLVASTPIAVSIGGLEGWRIDISMDPDWTQVCPFSEGQPVRGLFTDRPAGSGLQWNIGADARMRLYLLDLGDGRALLVDIEGNTNEYDAFVADATAVVESFEFAR